MKVPGLTRRELLRLAGLGTAGLLGSCGDDAHSRGPHEHAVAILEPDSESFLVSLWAAAARTYAVEVRAGDSILRSSTIELDASGTGVLDVRGLAAGQRYQVEAIADDGGRLGPCHVQTAPPDGDPRPVRIAVSADLDPYPEYASDLLEQMARRSPELFVSLGDFPYTDNGPPAVTVATYRERHVLTRTDPRIKRWLQTVGVRAIYDDHEFRNDWDAMFAASESGRYAAAIQVWDEFFPLRGAAGTEVRYRSWRWGAHLECFLLDCRRFRSPNAAVDDASKTMLGADQRAWLVDAVQRSTATFKVIFTSVPLDFGNGLDHWTGFTTERALVWNALAGIPGIVFVSADQHWFAAHQHPGGWREFQVGPLARGVIRPLRNDPGVLFRAERMNFALLDVDGDTLVLSGVGAGGEVFYKETLHADELAASAPPL
jgi:phosphodiesterase/alkaline phosphatase D-like protein